MFIVYENWFLFLGENNFNLFLLIIKEYLEKNQDCDEEIY